MASSSASSPLSSLDAMSSPTTSGCSSPLSMLSRSPSPPSSFHYPSPLPSHASSQTSSTSGSPSPDNNMDPRDEAPPAKRRRTSYEPKPRTTEYLSLPDQLTDLNPADKEQLDKLLKVLNKKRKIVVVAGAGISVSAGIPDFRSSKGLFKSLKKQHNLKSSGKDLFDASVYKDDTSTESFHEMIRSLSNMTKGAEPTPFHHLLATLAQEGRLLRLYSQNVDGIDTSLEPLETQVPLNRKAPWPKTIQLHGNLQKMVCSKCHEMSDLDPNLFDGPEPPVCHICVATDNARTEHAGKRSHGIGRLRPRMVLYNEHNPDDEAIGAVVKADLRTRPDALIVVGTTLKVPGVKRIVKEMCGVVRGRRDGATIWINMDTPPVSKDYEWDLIVKGPCDRVANVASMRHWYEPQEEQITNEHVQKVLEETRVEVVVFSPSKSNRMGELSLPTPTSSRSCSVPPQQLVPLAADEKQKKRKMQTKLKEPKPEKPKQQTKRVRKNPAQKTGLAKNPMKISFKTSKAGPPANTKDAKPVQPMQPVSPSHAKNNTLPPISQLPIFSDAFPAFQRTPLKVHEQPESPVQSPIISAPQSRRSSDPRMEISFLSNPSP